MPVVLNGFLSKSMQRRMLLAGGGDDATARQEVGEHSQVVTPLAVVHFIDAQVRQLGEVECGVGIGQTFEEQPPEPSVALAQNLAGLFPRHLTHESQREGF